MSTDQTHISVVTDEVLTVGLISWSRGQKSQAASAMRSGGVSAVMGSSDLDVHTLVSDGAPGNQLSCSLPFGAGRPIVGMACRAPDGLSQWVGLVKDQFLWLWTYTCLVIHLILICISFLQSICREPSMSVARECMV